MLTPRYPRLRDRLRWAELTLSIPCRHGWEYEHCNRDDDGSHVSELRASDFCYCGEAIHFALRLELAILAHRIERAFESRSHPFWPIRPETPPTGGEKTRQ